MEFSLQAVIGIIALLWTISSAGFFFLWNNLRADAKVIKDDLMAITQKLDTKADKAELDQRRNDIRDLYAKLNVLENTTKDAIHGAVLSVTNQISELKGLLNASPHTRNQRSR